MAIDHSHLDLVAVPQNIQIDSLSQVQAPIEKVSTWRNWSGNLSFKPTAEDGQYYFLPTTEAELKSIINQAALRLGDVKIRVSGQRHSATPLIVNSNLNNSDINTQHGHQWIVDMACYKDLGLSENEHITLDAENQTVTVNAGVTEDELDAYLTAHNFMLKTVTAGGFFSVGGLAAVDTHGATIDSSILANTVVAYTVMGANGKKITYDLNSPSFNGHHPLKFHRASWGTLGVITSITFKVEPRPFKNTLIPSQAYHTINSKEAFIETYKQLLFSDNYHSIESFYNPYSVYYNYLLLRWKVDQNPENPILNNPMPVETTSACDIALNKQWGAQLLNPVEESFVQNTGQSIQNSKSKSLGEWTLNKLMTNTHEQMGNAIENNDAIWVKTATRVTFMSYFIPLPNNKDHGLDILWKALEAINDRIRQTDDFILAIPPEFRFVRGSDALLAGAYSDDPNQLFVSIEILASTKKGDATNYPQNLLDFFANIEREWVKLGGFPHHGKLYGFYNPVLAETDKSVVGVAPFNPDFIKNLNSRRQERLKVFSEYQKVLDPNGIFSNAYTDSLIKI
ncbi:FAD-binding protein [Thiotrichales bacterium 19S9-12]|nr:FAD-binding protein [Thiotrichales bacterium 19S9-11]MCF6811560.1 FAD-binding protein [Thiotrichales bacterium 19S9-12]